MIPLHPLASADVADPRSAKIQAAIQRHWAPFKSDCSGFVKAVAAEVNIPLTGSANEIMDYLIANPSWRKADSVDHAVRMAGEGHLVIAGLKDSGHGHVAIVHGPPLLRPGVARGSWGSLGGVGQLNEGLNYSWRRAELAKVAYFFMYGT